MSSCDRLPIQRQTMLCLSNYTSLLMYTIRPRFSLGGHGDEFIQIIEFVLKFSARVIVYLSYQECHEILPYLLIDFLKYGEGMRCAIDWIR
jgi:hypothetical protein